MYLACHFALHALPVLMLPIKRSAACLVQAVPLAARAPKVATRAISTRLHLQLECLNAQDALTRLQPSKTLANLRACALMGTERRFPTLVLLLWHLVRHVPPAPMLRAKQQIVSPVHSDM